MKPVTSEDGQRLYTITEAAAMLNLKPDTLRWFIRRQHRVVPRRVGKASGPMLLSASDILRLYEDIKMERGY